MAKEYKLSPQRLKELQDELNYLKTVREREVAEQIKEARSFGDLSENSEYDEAKNEQGKLYSHIAEIEAILASYVLIEEKPISATAVSLGSQVLVLSKRPATIQTVVDIDFPGNISALERRNSPEFKDYFNKIWKELNENE